jgi:GTP-binding protein EngB required for normal cell division
MKGYYDYSVFYFILNMQKMENSNIFRLFERGERQISKAHRSAVLLVGMGKSGASSAFNWITRKRMGVVEDAFGPYFQNTTEEGAAEISSEFPTTTICPNFAELSEGVSLIDMPNYCSHRNYIG